MRYVIKNGKIVTEYGIKEGLSLVINEDKIEGIFIDSYTDKESCYRCKRWIHSTRIYRYSLRLY